MDDKELDFYIRSLMTDISDMDHYGDQAKLTKDIVTTAREIVNHYIETYYDGGEP